MQSNMGISIHNKFELTLTDAKTGELKQTAYAENIVCNTFLNYCVMGRSIAPTPSGYRSIHPGMEALVLGTGTGTPAVTDAYMFQIITAYMGLRANSKWARTRINENTYSYTATVVADENTANGDLTEIGLGESCYYDSAGWSDYNVGIYTHALFTDSEGNPIVISKKSTDRLTITATIYGTVTPSNNGNSVYIPTNARSAESSKIACDPRIPYVPGDSVFTSTVDNSILGSWGNISSNYTSASVYPDTLRVLNSRMAFSISATITQDNTTHTARATTDTRILADQSNMRYPSTIMIRSLRCNGVSVSLPNAVVYPPKQLTIERVADGIQTDFNLGIPELNPNNVEVYIGNELQPTNSYTFNGKDYTHIQAWSSFDTLYLDSFDYTSINYTSGSTTYFHHLMFPVYNGPVDSYSRTTTANEKGIFIYDFKSNYTVSAVGKYLPTGIYGVDNTRFVPKLYYSNDKENWTEVNGLWDSVSTYASAPNITAANPYIQINPISARYWKVVNPVIRCYDSVRDANDSQLCCSIAFDDPKPQLHFNNPPSAESTITIKAYCDYPIKNSNWIVEPGMTFDVTISQQ